MGAGGYLHLHGLHNRHVGSPSLPPIIGPSLISHICLTNSSRVGVAQEPKGYSLCGLHQNDRHPREELSEETVMYGCRFPTTRVLL